MPKKSFLLLVSIITLKIIAFNATHNNHQHIIFNRADLIAEYKTDYDKISLEAYASSSNDYIIKTKDKNKYAQLEWFSIGNPTLVKAENSYFKFNNDGFTMYANMLSNEHKKSFKHVAEKKYSIDIDENQVFDLIFSKFECSISIENRASHKNYLIRGKVDRFNVYPIRIEFHAPADTDERSFFENKIRQEETSSGAVDLKLKCELSSNPAGSNLKYYLILELETINRLDLIPKLFSSSSNNELNVYATYNQIFNLASTLYYELNVDEEFRLSQNEFVNSFIDDFLNQTSENGLKYEPFDDAIESLSFYNLNKDFFTLDIFKLDMLNLLKINRINHTEIISFNLETYDHIKVISNLNNLEFKASSSWYDEDMFGISLIFKFIELKTKEWIDKKKSINEQLMELNEYNDSQYKWRIDKNNRVLPARIKVSRLLKAKFANNFIFKNVFKEYSNEGYKRTIILKTRNDSPWNKPENDQRLQHIESLLEYLSKRVDNNSEVLGNYSSFVKEIKENLMSLRLDLNSLSLKVDVLNELDKSKNETLALIKNKTDTFENILSEFRDELGTLNETLFDEIKDLSENMLDSNSKLNNSLNLAGNKLDSLVFLVENQIADLNNSFYLEKYNLISRIAKLDKDLNNRSKFEDELSILNSLTVEINQTKRYLQTQNGLINELNENFAKLKSDLSERIDNFENVSSITGLNQENRLMEFIENKTQVLNIEYVKKMKKYETNLENSYKMLENLSNSVNKLNNQVASFEAKAVYFNKILNTEANSTFYLNKQITSLADGLSQEKNQTSNLEYEMSHLKEMIAKLPKDLSSKMNELHKLASSNLKKIENGINDDRRKLKKIDSELSNLNNKLNSRTQEVYDRVNSSNIKYDNSLRLVQDNLNNFYVKLFNSTRLFEVRMNNMNDSLNAENFNIYKQMAKLGDEIAREKNHTSRLRADLNYAINEVDKITNKKLGKN